MSKLPKKITIGPTTYAVVRDADTLVKYEHENKASVFGCIQYMKQCILLDPTCGADMMRYVLLHEVMHGCNHVAGHTSIEDEERIVTALAPILLDTLRRNPALAAYLLGGDA